MRIFEYGRWTPARVVIDRDGSVWVATCHPQGRGLCEGDPTHDCARCVFKPIAVQMELPLGSGVGSCEGGAARVSEGRTKVPSPEERETEQTP